MTTAVEPTPLAPVAPAPRPTRLARLLMLPILFYRWCISPWLPPACRYEPSCSRYALEALAVHGAARGSWLAARRIGRCHPWGGHGLDPVPPRRGAAATPSHDSTLSTGPLAGRPRHP